MSDGLPEALAAYALRRVVESRSPAFLRVAKDGRLVGWGGELVAYGLRGASEE